MQDENRIIDTSTIGLDDLRQESPNRQRWKQLWDDYDLLYKGGEEMLRSAGQYTHARSYTGSNVVIGNESFNTRRRRFLFQLEGEPHPKYNQRWERAFYLNYYAAILDYFIHWLFSNPPSIRVSDDDAENEDDAPSWFDSFMQDCCGNDTSFLDFAKKTFLDSMLYQYSGWLISSPRAGYNITEAEAQFNDLAPVNLTGYNAKEIMDYQRGDDGCLEWVVLCKKQLKRNFPNKREQSEVYTFLNKKQWAVWEVIKQQEVGDPDIRLIGEGMHGLDEVPFVMLEIPSGLWAANKLASWQIDIFNKQNMLAWSQIMSCFLQPFIKSNDDLADSRIFGESILMHLRCGGKDEPAEEFGWAAPPIEPLKFAQEAINSQRDEGYRIVHQMSLAVDSKTIGAVARSGQSKIEDRRSSEIILCGYGGILRDAIIQTLNMVSRIMGDNSQWQCEGYDNFNVSSLDEELQAAALVSTLNIPSATFEKEILSNIATGRLLGYVSDSVKEKIRQEISESIDHKQESLMAGMGEMNESSSDGVVEDEKAEVEQ